MRGWWVRTVSALLTLVRARALGFQSGRISNELDSSLFAAVLERERKHDATATQWPRILDLCYQRIRPTALLSGHAITLMGRQ